MVPRGAGAGAGLSHHLAPVGPDVAQVDLLLALARHDGVEQLLLALGEAGILGAALLAAGGDATHVAGGRLPGLRAARRGDLAAGPVPDPIHFDQLLGLGPSALSKHVLVAALHLADRGAIELPPRSIRVLLLRLDGRLGDHIAFCLSVWLPGAQSDFQCKRQSFVLLTFVRRQTTTSQHPPRRRRRQQFAINISAACKSLLGIAQESTPAKELRAEEEQEQEQEQEERR